MRLTWLIVLAGTSVRTGQCQPPKSNVLQTDLASWQQLFDATDGPGWVICSDKYSSPCECDAVECELVGDQWAVSAIKLFSNELHGFLSSSVLDGFSSALTRVELNGNEGLRAASGPWLLSNGNYCLDANVCSRPGATCIMPDSMQTCLQGSDLGVWRELYDNTNGEAWNECSEFRDTPCDCGQVVCEFDFSLAEQGVPKHIVAIDLVDNNMNGVLPDLTARLPKLRHLRLGGNLFSSVANNADYGCIDILERCGIDVSDGGVDCGSDEQLQAAIASGTLCTVSDLGGWRAFYDGLHEDPHTWQKCEDSREDPCACTSISCNANGKITSIVMPENNLRGLLPVRGLEKMEFLEELLLEDANPSSQTPNSFGLPPDAVTRRCIPISRCFSSDATCNLGFDALPFCEPLAFQDPNPTPANLYLSDFWAWQTFFDYTGGDTWNRCPGTRNDPCACVLDSKRKVVCRNKRIESITLQQNDMLLDDLDMAVPYMRALVRSGSFTGLWLNNLGTRMANGVTPGTPCVSFPECQFRIACQLPPELVFCHTTSAPTLSPTPFPTRSPTPRPTIASLELKSWQALYDALNGPEWTYCSTLREDPCNCQVSASRYVSCEGPFITRIHLESNNMQGFAIPNVKLDQLQNLQEFVLTNDAGGLPNVFTAYGDGGAIECINLPACTSPGVECRVAGAKFCHETPPPTVPQTPSPTSSVVHPTDLAFWQHLYDSTDGDNWIADCSRSHPCSCNAGVDRAVKCENEHIVDVVLKNNNMRGFLGIETFLPQMPALKRIILSSSASSNSPNVFSNTDCVVMPACSEDYTKTCDFSNTGIRYCQVTVTTQSPTSFPTKVPSASPTTKAPTTRSPTPYPTSFPTVVPTSAPTRTKYDYLARVRFIDAVFNNETKQEKLHQGYLERAFPDADEIKIVSIVPGSVVVSFALVNYTGRPIGRWFDLSNRIIQGMNTAEKLLLRTENFQVEYLSEPSPGGSTGNGQVGWPTMAPTTLAPTQAPTPPTMSPTQAPIVKPPPQLAVSAEKIVAAVAGGVFGLSLLVYLFYKNRKPSERKMNRKASWKMDDHYVNQDEEEKRLRVIPSEKNILVSRPPGRSTSFEVIDVSRVDKEGDDGEVVQVEIPDLREGNGKSYYAARQQRPQLSPFPADELCLEDRTDASALHTADSPSDGESIFSPFSPPLINLSITDETQEAFTWQDDGGFSSSDNETAHESEEECGEEGVHISGML